MQSRPKCRSGRYPARQAPGPSEDRETRHQGPLTEASDPRDLKGEELVSGSVPGGQDSLIARFVARATFGLFHAGAVLHLGHRLCFYRLLGAIKLKAIRADFLLSESHTDKKQRKHTHSAKIFHKPPYKRLFVRGIKSVESEVCSSWRERARLLEHVRDYFRVAKVTILRMQKQRKRQALKCLPLWVQRLPTPP